jgi:hypothetical protein
MSEHTRTTNDLLLQVLEGQQQLLGEFKEHKGQVNQRVDALESTAKWNKIMSYIVNPAMGIIAAIAMHFGIPIMGKR